MCQTSLPGVDMNFEFKFVAALNKLRRSEPEDSAVDTLAWVDNTTLVFSPNDYGKCK